MVDNNYCVYIHRNKRTDEIFYVGSGRIVRANTSQQRGSKWKQVVAEDGYYPEILYENLSKQDSLVKELECYEYYSNKVKLANAFPPRQLAEYPVEILKEHLRYDETSPTCLRRLLDSPTHKGGKSAKAGDVAGSQKDGARLIKVLNTSYLIHKVVWLLHGNDLPFGWVIDHIDGNPSNNRIDNLRAITQAENCRNQKLARNNKSGVAGVRLHVIGRGRSSSWSAKYVKLDGTVVEKAFTISLLGDEEAFRQACEWRREQIELLNSQGAGYTERHGT